MIQRRHMLTALGLLALAWPATALATQPCEPAPPTHYAPRPNTLELSVSAKQVCGLQSNRSMSAYAFEFIGERIPASEAQQNQPHLLEFDDSQGATWTPSAAAERPWMVEQAVSIRPVSIDDAGKPLSSTDTRHCYALPTLEPGRYLVIDDDSPDAPTRNVASILHVVDRPADPPPKAQLQRIEPRDVSMACKDHGFFEASMGDKPDAVWAYTWTVRDADKRVVQTGVGLQPRAVAQSTDDSGEFAMGEFHGIGETKRPYIAGQSYEMEVRAVGFDGQRSEPTHGQFVFEQTGEGRSFEGLVIRALLGCTTIFVAAYIFLVWALSRRKSS